MSIISPHRANAKPGLTLVERPRGVDPRRLGGRPGVSADVMASLYAFAERDEARRPAPKPIALRDWNAELKRAADEAQALVEERIAHVAAVATRRLDTIANTLTFSLHMLTVPVFEELRDIERDLVDAVAEWIVAEVATDAALLGTEETGTEVAR